MAPIAGVALAVARGLGSKVHAVQEIYEGANCGIC
jgi:hypothetical protein